MKRVKDYYYDPWGRLQSTGVDSSGYATAAGARGQQAGYVGGGVGGYDRSVCRGLPRSYDPMVRTSGKTPLSVGVFLDLP